MNTDFIFNFSRFRIHLSDPSDLANRFTYQMSCAMLITVSTLISLRQYYSSMMQCIFAADFSIRGLDYYAENICWAQNTLFVEGQIQEGNDMVCASSFFKGAKVINYYKWIPIMLGGQCFMCYFPHLIWKLFHIRSGLNLKTMVHNASDAVNRSGDVLERELGGLAHTISDALYLQREHRDGCFYKVRQFLGSVLCCFGAKRVGNYLTLLHLFVKALYVGNAALQVWMMARFLKLPVYFGAQLMYAWHEGQTWNVSSVFPLVSICKFPVQFGNLAMVDVCAQCVIPFNFLLEGLYIALWFWFVFVLFISTYSLLQWFYRCLPWSRRHFVNKYFDLMRMGANAGSRKTLMEAHLRCDGVLILRMIGDSAGEHCVATLVRLIWARYLERLREIHKDNMQGVTTGSVSGTRGAVEYEDIRETAVDRACNDADDRASTVYSIKGRVAKGNDADDRASTVYSTKGHVAAAKLRLNAN